MKNRILDTLLSIEDLSVSFRGEGGEFNAIENVSFDIRKGETLGIVGESGSGKSVTALSVMRLLPAGISRIISGNIIFQLDGEKTDLLQISEKEMRGIRGKEISMIFQEPMTSLNPVMKCGRQVVEMIDQHMDKSREESRKMTLQLFEEVMLPEPERIFNAYPHQLSGGQRQRVMIAMALSCNPSLIIADEPTTALDVTVQKSILSLLKSLQEKYGMAVLFITHDLDVIKEIADEVLVMYQGKIVEKGLTTKILENPEHDYTHGLINCKPSMKVRMRRLPVVEDFVEGRAKAGEVGENLIINETERTLSHKIIYSKDPVLVARDINVHFLKSGGLFSEKKYNKAVDGVSFEVYKGETLGLVGESGCGKTTLGRALLRLVEMKSGLITYKGEEISKLSQHDFRKFRKNLQIIFQDPYSTLNPRIMTGRGLIEPMEVHGIGKSKKERREIALELLEKVGLEPSHFYRYPHEFSGGQRQRISIARALTLNPEFIICDESVSALDVSVQAQILNLLNDLKHEFGFTYVFISHDLAVVKFMSDRLIVMKDGKIVESGEADAIYSHPKSEYTRQLIESVPGK